MALGYTTLDERRELCGACVTLDGKPAVVMGAQCRFAHIGQLEAPHLRVEYAWETVARIIERNGGEFRG